MTALPWPPSLLETEGGAGEVVERWGWEADLLHTLADTANLQVR